MTATHQLVVHPNRSRPALLPRRWMHHGMEPCKAFPPPLLLLFNSVMLGLGEEKLVFPLWDNEHG